MFGYNLPTRVVTPALRKSLTGTVELLASYALQRVPVPGQHTDLVTVAVGLCHAKHQGNNQAVLSRLGITFIFGIGCLVIPVYPVFPLHRVCT